MSSIDQRTVKMSFDNAEFEKRVGTTLGTLDKLKQSLNFTGATKGMEEINAAANRISFDRLADSIDNIQYRFSVLGEFVHNTFMNMIDTAVNAGKQIADSLLLTPLKDGFSEYETQMNSIQTILANTESKGTTLDDVNRALDELNAYADKTIYNFTEMTRNIGTFTAAGVDLNTSVSAIQGIANLAAVSGSNSEQASRAMYQLSQALSSGVVHLQDWNSVVNAGMGGEVFQKAIMDTARVHGIAIDEMMESAGSFRAMLNAQDYGDWLNSDILLESLEKFTAGSEGITQEQLKQMQELYRARGYTEEQIKSLTESQRVLTDAEIEEIKATWRAKGYTEEQVEEIFKMGQTATDAATKVKTFSQLLDTLKEALGSGWTQSWEYIVGDFEQAKELWTEISDILSIYINASANARNATLKEWSEGGGRAAVIDSIRNAFQALLGVLIPVKRAFDEVFPAITAQQLIEYSNKLKDFTASLKLTDEEGKNVQQTAVKIFGYLKKSINGIINLGKTAIDIFATIGTAIGRAFNVKDLSIIGKIVNRFEKFTEALRPSETILNNLGRLVTGLTSVFKAFITIVVNAGSSLFDSFGKVFSGLSGDIENFMAYLGDIGDKLTDLSNKLIDTFTIKNLSGFDSIASAVSNLIDIVRQAVDIPDILGKIINYIFGIDFSGILNGINGVAEGASNGVDVIHNAIVNFMSSGAIPNLIAKISEFVSGINWKAIFNIFSHIESFVATKSLMSLAKSFKNLPETLGELIDKIKDVSNTPVGAVTNLLNGVKESLEAWQKNLKAAILVEIGIALVAIAMAIKTVSEIDPSRVVSSLELLGGGIAETLVLVKALDKMNIKSVPNLWGLAQVMGQMAKLLKEIGAIEPERLKPSVIAMGILLGELAIALKVMNGISLDAKETLVSTAAIFVLTQAVKSLSKSLKTLGSLSWKQIVKGLGAIGGLMLELVATIRLLPTDKAVSGAGTMIALAVAIRIMSKAVETLGNLSLNQIIKGLGAIGVLLAEMTIAIRNFPDSGKLLSSAFAMVVMAVAIKSLTGSLERLSAIKSSSLIKSLGALAVMLTAMTVSLNYMPDSGKLLSSSVAMLAMAIAISSITGSLERLSAIQFTSLVKSLGAFAVVLGGLTLALNLMPDSGKLLSSSVAMLAISASVIVITGALERLAQIKATSLIKAIGGLGASLLILSAAANSFNGAIVGAAAMVIVAGAVALLAPALTMLSNINIGGLIIALGALAGTMVIFGIAATVLAPTVGVLLAFGAAVAIAGLGLFALSSALGAVASIVASSGTQISEAFSIILQAMIDNVPLVGELIITTFTTIFNAASEIIPQFVELVISTIYTIYSKIAEYVPMFAETGFQIILSFLAVIAEHIGELVVAGANIVVSFLNGVSESLYMIIEAAFNLIISFINGLAEAIRRYHHDLWSAVMNLISAICEALLDGVKQIVGTTQNLLWDIIDEIGKFYNKMYTAGTDLVWGFIDGLWSMVGHVWDAACDLAMTAWNAITGTLDEHSPSRLSFGGGVNFIQGFINGMIDREHATISEAGAVAYAALTAFQAGLDSGVDYNPTITPVINSNEIQNGINSINSMLYQIPDTYGITTNIANDKAMKKQLVEIMGSSNDYTDIIGSINNLRSDLQIYNDQLSKMQIVMDSGTLVGELTPGFDRSLGMRQMMVGRGAI